MKLTAKAFDELTNKELYEILKARAEIFVVEQNIHYQDMDDVDYNCLHCFFMENGRVISYFRAFYENEDTGVVKIGRVLTISHGKGYGRELLLQGIEAIKSKMKCKKIIVDAQKHAVGFYKRFGFVTTSDDFIEEKIVHQSMKLDL